mgnify:CR=1 FL=1
MPTEIERKFLVSTPPENLENFNSNEIVQGYIFISDDLEIRLRRKGNLYFQTIKSSGDLERSEYEIELTKDQFETLWPFTEGKRILKTRYEIDYQNHLIELDIYSESLQGLKTAEVEFKSAEESNKFKPPSWFGEDVTRDKKYKNKNLALFGIPDQN